MSRLDELLARHPVADWRTPAAVATALLAAAGVWMSVARFDEVVSAHGEVVPQGQVKTVQHLEGGIIAELLVGDGDKVVAGDPLVRLDPTRIAAGVGALRAELDGLEIKRARLDAEAAASEPAYPPEPSARRPAVLAAERRSHEDRVAELAAAREGARQRIQQRRLEIEGTHALLAGTMARLEVARERAAVSAALLEDDLTSRMDDLRIRAEVEELDSAVAQAEAALPQARAALAEAVEHEREVTLEFRRQASTELVETEVEIARRREMLVAASDQQRRADIAAPIDGVVQNMRYHTVGGVIRAGEPILTVVPVNDSLLIEAKVDPRDIAHVKADMRATVKISAYDFIRYGALDGRVVNVAADANTDDSGWQHFRIAVQTGSATLGDDRLRIMPGMLATVDIHTGRKRVAEYLVGPVVRMRHEAFRER